VLAGWFAGVSAEHVCAHVDDDHHAESRRLDHDHDHDDAATNYLRSDGQLHDQHDDLDGIE
jgi:hypothetical protein